MIAMQPSLTVLKIETFSFSGGSTVFTYQETYTMTPHLYFNPSQLTRLTTLRPSHVPDTPKNPRNNDAQVYASIASCYFGGARSKGFATLRNVSKLPFFDKIGHAKSAGFRFYSAIRDHFDFFNSFEEERIIILASPGFEPTHLCDPSDQRRL